MSEREAGFPSLEDIEEELKKERYRRSYGKVLKNTIFSLVVVAAGQYREAEKLYDETTELYRMEEGLKPSGKLQEIMKRMGKRMEHGYAGFEEIVERMECGESAGQGGYVCSYPVFTGLYQMVRRIMQRSGQSVFLMLCTIVDSKGNPLKEGRKLQGLSVKLGESIGKSVRQSDAVNRYGEGQYLVLLTNTTREDCRMVQKRIDRNFLEGRQRIRVQYHVGNVI